MELVYPKEAQLRILTVLKTELMDAGEMALFSNDITPDVNTVVADLTEATFTGYARATLTTWLAARLNTALEGVQTSPLAAFAAAAPFTVGEDVYGGWIEDSNGDLILMFRFDNAPIPMAAVGNAIVVAVDHILGNPAGQGMCSNE